MNLFVNKIFLCNRMRKIVLEKSHQHLPAMLTRYWKFEIYLVGNFNEKARLLVLDFFINVN